MLSDGVSKLWVLRREHGLNISGFTSEAEAIGYLIRHALSFGPPEAKAQIESAVAEALKHLDPEQDDASVDD